MIYHFPFAGLFQRMTGFLRCGNAFLSHALRRVNGIPAAHFLMTCHNLPMAPCTMRTSMYLSQGSCHFLLRTYSQHPTAPGIKSRFPTIAFKTLHELALVCVHLALTQSPVVACAPVTLLPVCG